VALGTTTAQSGFAAATGDKIIADIWVSNTTSPFVDIDTLAPKPDIAYNGLITSHCPLDFSLFIGINCSIFVQSSFFFCK
jgi:hypothetical protein